jgi:hypothetical protein
MAAPKPSMVWKVVFVLTPTVAPYMEDLKNCGVPRIAAGL